MSPNLDDAARQDRAQRSKPTKADVVALVGQERIKELPGGKWETTINGKREMDAFHEMTNPWREAEIAWSGEVQGRERDVQVRMKKTGERRYVKESDEHRLAGMGKLAARKGLTITVPALPWKDET